MLAHPDGVLRFPSKYYIPDMPLDPASFRTPGQFLQALLDERDWNQSLLSVVLGIPRQHISRYARDQRPIDAETALIFGEVFGYSPKAFLLLQQRYDLRQARLRSRPNPARSHLARLYGDLPLKEMMNRGWLNVSDIKDVKQVEGELARFFGVANVADIEIFPHAAKRTNVIGAITPAQLVWLHRVRSIAANTVVPRYSTAALQDAVRQMKQLLMSTEEARKVPRLLAEAGVRFVVVESLPGAKIDGVCFWLDDRSPVIGMSMRFDRIDNFWFVLRHEIEHVLRGHGRGAAILDTEMERDRGEEAEEEEQIANAAAADFCVPSKTLAQFVARKDPVFTTRDILGFAKVVKVHPGLVAGQLQRATGRYERFRDLLSTVRAIVLPNAVHDGWGDVAPLVV